MGFFDDILDQFNLKKPKEYLTEDSFKSTPAGPGINILPSIPTTAKDILQGTARSGGSVSLSVSGLSELKTEDLPSYAQTAKKIIFGDEPIKSIGQRAKEVEPWFKDHWAGKLSYPLSYAFVGGLTALDFTGFGGQEKTALKAITKLTDASKIATRLKGLGIADELIEAGAKKLATVTDAGEVSAYYGKLKSLSKVMKAEEPAVAKVATVGKNGANIADETKKESSFVYNAVKDIPERDLHRIAKMRIGEEAQARGREALQTHKDDLADIYQKKVTMKEVRETAEESDYLLKSVSREESLKMNAAIKAAEAEVAGQLQAGTLDVRGVKLAAAAASQVIDAARTLVMAKMEVNPELSSPALKLLKRLTKITDDSEAIANAFKGVDINDAQELLKIYRTFVKPTLGEILSEMRYINLLSSPKTQIVNTFSNFIQGTVLRPATRLFSGAVDAVASTLTGKERQYFISQVPAYYRGMFNSASKAADEFAKAFSGKVDIARPDVFFDRAPTNLPILKSFQVIPRLMEATDVFFRTLIAGGEKEAITLKYLKKGLPVPEEKIIQEAADVAAETVFRKELDPLNKSGQGYILSKIDNATSALYDMRQKFPMLGWWVPFIQTPMSILKQGLEYSPLGVTTLVGNTKKTEQIAKSMIGSIVFAFAGSKALSGEVTWAAPTNKKEKEQFYAAGMQPYSVKVGNKWVNMSRLGPISYPLAMAAALQYFAKEDPKAQTESRSKKAQNVFGGIAQYFSDQSYMEGIQGFANFARGDISGISQAASDLPAQLVPLSSLQRWVAQLIDPIYRKPGSGLSTEAVINNLKVGIPFLSKDVEPYLTPSGEPSKRQYPYLNAVSPLGITKENPESAADFRTTQELRRADLGVQAERDNEKERILPMFQQAQDFISQGNFAGAQAIVNSLSPEDYEVYKKLKQSENRTEKTKLEIKVFPRFQKAQILKAQGDIEGANNIVNSLTPEEYKVYKSFKNKYKDVTP